MPDKNDFFNDEIVEEYLSNGRGLKASVNKTIDVEVVQWEREEGRYGRELFYLSAKINPRIDINAEGYVTQAWFRMSWIKDINELNGVNYYRMKPAYFIMPDPLVYFRCYIDDSEVCLLPDPELNNPP